MSACCVRVGMPVEGPPRCTLMMVTGISAKYARPMNSVISDTPGPEVAVNALEQAMTLGILCVGALLVMRNDGFTIGMLVAFQMFASRSVAVHVVRGVLGLVVLVAGIALAGRSGWWLLLLPLTVVLWRGCPTCWVMGLIATNGKRNQTVD